MYRPKKKSIYFLQVLWKTHFRTKINFMTNREMSIRIVRRYSMRIVEEKTIELTYKSPWQIYHHSKWSFLKYSLCPE